MDDIRQELDDIRQEVEADQELFGKRSVRLPLSESMRLLLVFTYATVKEFPRYEKNGLGLEIRTVTWSIQRQILNARRYQRLISTPASLKAQRDRLERLCVELDLLKFMVRAAVDRRHMSIDAYGEWARHLVGIGSQLGGWLKSVYER